MQALATFFFIFSHFVQFFRTKCVPLHEILYNKDMSRTDDIKRMRQLEQELDYHSQRYYVDNAPEISDFEFDALLRELQDLELFQRTFAISV